jgi:hypothetical protein
MNDMTEEAPMQEHTPECRAIHFPGTPCFDTPTRKAFVHQPGCNVDHTQIHNCMHIGSSDFGREEVIRNQHAYHPPTDQATITAHQIVRAKTLGLAIFFENLLPEGDEKEYALKAIREAMMWGNAAIAIHGVKQ